MPLARRRSQFCCDALTNFLAGGVFRSHFVVFPLVPGNTVWHRRAAIMKPAALNRRRYDILTGILLAMLLLRAYVPVGFMPAGGTPFLLELCPSASPVPGSLAVAAHHAHHDHDHDHGRHDHAATHGHFENCPFGSAPGAGPASQLVVFQPSGQVASLESVEFESFYIGARVARAHQPRGPPALA
jgi:hypothetical protein